MLGKLSWEPFPHPFRKTAVPTHFGAKMDSILVVLEKLDWAGIFPMATDLLWI